MRFSFKRSVVLKKVRRVSKGMVEITRTFTGEKFKIPAEGVRCVTSRYLSDSSTILVDFGPERSKTQEAVIAAGRKDRIPIF